jgi:hypothetical protein
MKQHDERRDAILFPDDHHLAALALWMMGVGVMVGVVVVAGLAAAALAVKTAA